MLTSGEMLIMLKANDIKSVYPIDQSIAVLHANFNVITKIINSTGWHVGAIHDEGIELFPDFTTKIIYVPRFLYHATKKSNIQSILKYGLIPSTSKNFKQFMYPPRVFLFRPEFKEISKEDKLFKLLLPKLALEIDTQLLDPGCTFYEDIAWDPTVALWTPNKISPRAIKEIAIQ